METELLNAILYIMRRCEQNKNSCKNCFAIEICKDIRDKEINQNKKTWNKIKWMFEARNFNY